MSLLTPTNLTIGKYKLTNCLLLAPMAGVTDRPFRQLCKQNGAGMAVSEMISSNSLLWGSEKTKRKADHSGEIEPRAVQIAGADPELMAAAAVYNVNNGAQIIDINMGCPAKKVCNVMAGSALLRNEELVKRILAAVIEAVTVPVTLKIRTGWDKQQRNALRIAQIAEAMGVQALTIHGRTRACGYKGEAEYDSIAEVKAAVNKLSIIANGDIRSPEKALFVLNYTQADGIMIGRAAQGNPWIFKQIWHYLQTGEHLLPPSNHEIRAVLLAHIHNLYEFYGEHTGLLMARKHLGWYSKGQAHAADFRHSINQATTTDQQLALIDEFFR